MIRELIKQKLTEQNVSQKQFAERMNIRPSTLNDYLNERRPLPYDDLERVLIALDLLKQP
ncbi:MAG: helix-turn-helix transcriptional regulator [Bacteroidales bacterium]